MAKRRKKGEKSAARRRAEADLGGFEGTTIRMPEGWSFFEVKSDRVRKLSIADYKVGKGNPHAEPGEWYFERTFFTHRGVGIDGNTYVCPRKTFGKRCPICEEQQKLKQRGAEKSEITDLNPKERQLWIVRDEQAAEDGWKIWDYSHYLFGKQLLARIRNSDEEDGYDYFSDHEEGMFLKVGFEEKKLPGSNPFFACTTIDFKPRPALSADEIASFPCLDELLVETPYEELKNIFYEIDSDESDDDDEEEAVKEEKPKSRRSTKKKPAQKKKPASSSAGRRKKKKAPEPEPEPEPDPDPEEEEEEAAASDGGSDASSDGGSDASSDGGSDASSDGGSDASSDGGSDGAADDDTDWDDW